MSIGGILQWHWALEKGEGLSKASRRVLWVTSFASFIVYASVSTAIGPVLPELAGELRLAPDLLGLVLGVRSLGRSIDRSSPSLHDLGFLTLAAGHQDCALGVLRVLPSPHVSHVDSVDYFLGAGTRWFAVRDGLHRGYCWLVSFQLHCGAVKDNVRSGRFTVCIRAIHSDHDRRCFDLASGQTKRNEK
jgi:hypothetical protein